MFLTKLKFVAVTIMKWFIKEIKITNLELNIYQKVKYEKLNLIELNNGECCNKCFN